MPFRGRLALFADGGERSAGIGDVFRCSTSTVRSPACALSNGHQIHRRFIELYLGQPDEADAAFFIGLAEPLHIFRSTFCVVGS